MSLAQLQSNAAEAVSCTCASTSAQAKADVDPKLLPLLPDNIFFIDSNRVAAIMQEMGYGSPFDLLHEILKLAARRARPPISNFYVGAVGLSKAGNIYCGVNIEFDTLTLNDSIHGEQCLIARLANADEEGVVCFCVNAPPCGHCRQFINELDVSELKIAITGKGTFSLDQLLPFSFGPNDLGNATRLMRHPSYDVTLLPAEGQQKDTQLVDLAVKAASRAYSPYTECPSGCATYFFIYFISLFYVCGKKLILRDKLR
jgi:cytidine deaminase